ncbi:DUF1156 domain-containing protein [Pseudarthrobacter oxydans]|uniref:DUF1156 domain-containing protein n=1 Tax=Pseudarthrobacter oxydans TaxID=1671 RepID=UPI0037F9F297
MTEPIHRKLIEVALPLEAINRESQRDNSTLSGHPWNLHYWFARRKLPACRAMLFAQLVDDPSSRPEDFPTEKDQETERKRLFAMIERLVVWDNAGDESLLKQAHDEILKSSHGNPPPILDPFAGGGSIPLEAQRLGLDAHASDLNPVAVLINKGLIELPAKFAGSQPVHPDVGRTIRHWPRATGLAEDVLHYGMWMRAQAEQRIGNLYPKAQLENGTTADVIAWIWARTVKCPNPACRSEIPLASTWWLSKKKERPTWIHPVVKGKQVEFEIRVDKSGPSDPPKKGRGAKFTCLICSDTTSDAYIKSEAVAGRMGARLLSVVAEGKRQRVYLPASALHVEAADIARPEDVPEEKLAIDPRNIWCVSYGLTKFSDLFTNRQLVALTTFSDLVSEARDRVAADAKVAGRTVEEAEKYADAVALYLAFVVDRASDNWSSIASWHSGNGQLRNVFARQAIPMVWDYAEANPFSSQSVGWENLLARCTDRTR